MVAAADQLAAVVLAAGAGTRLRPITHDTPKALVPVGNVPLVDLAIGRVRPCAARVAVNAHHHLDAMRTHLGGRVHLSFEPDEALGTAGAIGHLRGWLDGAPVLIHNCDAYLSGGLDHLVDGWDGTTARLLVDADPTQPDFHGLWRFAGASLLPWDEAKRLPDEPAGLYEVCWRRLAADGRLELVPTTAAYIDCGTPADYLAANLLAAGGDSLVAADAQVGGAVSWSVVGAGARVAGAVVRSVVLPGATVAAGEHLHDAIRLPGGDTLRPLAG